MAKSLIMCKPKHRCVGKVWFFKRNSRVTMSDCQNGQKYQFKLIWLACLIFKTEIRGSYKYIYLT